MARILALTLLSQVWGVRLPFSLQYLPAGDMLDGSDAISHSTCVKHSESKLGENYV